MFVLYESNLLGEALTKSEARLRDKRLFADYHPYLTK
jgi:hypothetical protein